MPLYVTGMRVLDGDEEILQSRGRKCDRDIVQVGEQIPNHTEEEEFIRINRLHTY